MTSFKPTDPRLVELLADHATQGLPDEEHAELAARSSQGAHFDWSYELAAAAIDAATIHLEAMPAHVAARALGENVVPLRPKASREWARPAVLGGWIAAAACLLLAIGGWAAFFRGRATSSAQLKVDAGPPPSLAIAPPAPPTPAEARERMLEESKDAVRIEWKTTKDPLAQGASGDVVWSETEQRGFMRFHGLRPNDANESQYQLWIFDKAQKYPVDGGVFDVAAAAGDGDVVVPITAKLKVAVPTLFAVTVEKPGGVVVSKREHIVVTAAVGPG